MSKSGFAVPNDPGRKQVGSKSEASQKQVGSNTVVENRVRQPQPLMRTTESIITHPLNHANVFSLSVRNQDPDYHEQKRVKTMKRWMMVGLFIVSGAVFTLGCSDSDDGDSSSNKGGNSSNTGSSSECSSSWACINGDCYCESGPNKDKSCCKTSDCGEDDPNNCDAVCENCK